MGGTKDRLLALTLPGAAGMLLIAHSACTTRASNPTNNQTRAKFAQAETKTIYVSATDTIITAYNDQSGISVLNSQNPDERDPLQPHFELNNTQLVWVGQTFAGFSVWPNVGAAPALANWQTPKLIQPRAPSSCPTSEHCVFIMRGDPALATNGQRVLYGNIAYTDYTRLGDVPKVDGRERGPDALAIARDDTGTGAFGQPYVAAYLPGVFVDQPSLSMLGNVAVAAFNDGNTSSIYLVTTDDSGGDSWYPAQNLFIPFGFTTRGHAVVKLASPTLAYLAYMEEFSGQTGYIFRNTVVVRLTRSAGPTWVVDNGSPIFLFSGSEMSSAAPGAQSRSWQDLAPVDLELGNGGRELHVVFRQSTISQGPSRLFYFHCLDNPVGTCSSLADFTQENFSTPGFTGSVFQPWVSADPTLGSSVAAVTWYQQQAELSPNFAVFGAYTGSSIADHMVSQISQVYQPCPTNVDSNTGLGTFGDYESSTWTPYQHLAGTIDNLFFVPNFVTTYARSTQCTITATTLLNPDSGSHVQMDQFVAAVTW